MYQITRRFQIGRKSPPGTGYQTAANQANRLLSLSTKGRVSV